MPTATTFMSNCNYYQPKQDQMIQAARDGNLEAVTDLLSDNAVNVNGVGESDYTALQFVCQEGHRDVAELLLDHGATLDIPSFLWACSQRHHTLIQFLLERGANVNAVNDRLETPLHFATHDEDKELCELLLLHGADVTMEDAERNTPLDVAYEKGSYSIHKLLSKYENDVSSLDEKLHLKMEALKQSCNRVLDGIEVALCNVEQRIESNKRGGNELHVPQGKRAKLDDENRVAKLLKKCEELQGKTVQSNQDLQEIIEKMDKKSFRNNMSLIGCLAGFWLMKS